MSTPNDPYGYDPYGQPPSYPAQPYPAYQPYPGYPPPQGLQDPDQAMGIVGLILSVLGCYPVGLLVSWIAHRQSRDRGYKNTLATVGMIIGGVFTGLTLLAVLAYGGLFLLMFLIAGSGTALI
ncbi:Uncharacterised protein (plasmid) [Tsukamurella tyrosinosolvens]|uniref:DUF4190 domain-containing protein n=1 Tax=Tsukamurella tyrosinosolvens TaxID=57704 RepID=A0A1H4MW10_TSUTY|nr:DUF4190 domain-containing protein [Tsukamurella tyrosinosolvens]KXO96968.1 hypothetical protein AXK58_06800 [Tsukamurella tyrosinosolvens]SEB87251.1 hypothetical protein SAMN04489793_0986 [Tsukamurella tyrosinosolvens]VEI00577.1 Uncharacterised protein [Tsukamurella tyrosinosolvens]